MVRRTKIPLGMNLQVLGGVRGDINQSAKMEEMIYQSYFISYRLEFECPLIVERDKHAE
jgi:hypothetical protein